MVNKGLLLKYWRGTGTQARLETAYIHISGNQGPIYQGIYTCDKVKLPVNAEVTDQIQEEKAWILISGDINQIKRVRVGALVERAPVK